MTIIRVFIYLENLIGKINTWIHAFLSILVLFLALITLYGVIMRYVFNAPPIWGSQVLMLLFIPIATIAGGYAYLKDDHVRLDLLYARWSARGKAISNALTFLPFLLLTIVLAKVTIEMAWDSIKLGEVYTQYVFKGPVYPRKIALAIAVILLLITGVVLFFRNLSLIKKGR